MHVEARKCYSVEGRTATSRSELIIAPLIYFHILRRCIILVDAAMKFFKSYGKRSLAMASVI